MPRRRRNPSVLNNAFASVPSMNRRRSVFNRSSALKTTIPFDKVVPIYVDEVLPGDTFKMKMAYVMRLPALQVPIMDNLHCSIHFFYVPNRLLWKNWKDFIAGSPEPWQWNQGYDAYGNVRELVSQNDVLKVDRTKKGAQLRVPQCVADAKGYRRGSIYDLFGLPTGVPTFRHSALPFRAYDLIWNEYYRDENLQDSVLVLDGDTEEFETEGGAKLTRQYELRPRNKRYDYFTSAQPSPQKGEDSLVNLQISNTYTPYGITNEKQHPLARDGFDRYPVHGFSFETRPGSSGDPYNFEAGPVVDGTSVSYADLDYFEKDGHRIDNIAIANTPRFYDRQDSLPTHYADRWQGPGYYGEFTYYAPGSTGTRTDYGKVSAKLKPWIHWDGNMNSGDRTAQVTADEWPIYVEIPKASTGTGPGVGAGVKASFSIADLRYAAVMQHWAEACAKYGTRYNEAIAGHFGVQVGDYRVQRPEFLGGCKFLVNVSPIAQTSRTEGNAALGELAGIAASSGTKRLFTRSFVEHGLIIGLASFYSDLTYYQGVDRNPWLRENRFDYYWPEFAHLGPQEIYNKEIFCKSDGEFFHSLEAAGYADDNITDDVIRALPANYLPFGFQERYAEYRFKNSRVCGYMRPLEPGHTPSDTNWTFKNWTLVQEFEKDVRLNSEFIKCKTPMDNVLARQDNNGKVPAKYQVVLSDFYFDLKCVRPLPIYATPGLSRL